MIKIEDFWIDKVIYNVDFLANVPDSNDNKDKKISKTLIMSHEITLSEMEKIIFTKFKRVTKIIKIDEVMDGLIMKDFK